MCHAHILHRIAKAAAAVSYISTQDAMGDGERSREGEERKTHEKSPSGRRVRYVVLCAGELRADYARRSEHTPPPPWYWVGKELPDLARLCAILCNIK